MRKVASALLAGVALASWLFTLHVARREFHLTPDAVDYLTIARQRALGRGWTMPVKWHWFHDAPPPFPAWGQRSIGWPAVARWATLIDPLHPGPAAQVLNTALIAVAAALWGLVAAQAAGAALAGWLMAALMLTSQNTLVVSVTALSEPLYLVELGLLVLVLGPRRPEGVSALAAAALAALGTLAACVTRPSGAVVVVAVLLHLLVAPRRPGDPPRWRPALLWAAIVTLGLSGVELAAWRAWGGPPPSLTRSHLICLDITEGMFGGWGRPWPTPAAFLAQHWPAVLAKVVDHALVYTEALLATSTLGLLSPLLALVVIDALGVWRPWALLWLLALGHWLAAVVTWATTDTLRLAIPATVCLLPLCLGAGRRLIEATGGRRPVGLAAGLILALALALGGADMMLKARQLASPAAGARPRSEADIPLPFGHDEARTVCTDSPFVLAYRSDLPCVIFPFDLAQRVEQSASAWAAFFDEQRVAWVALSTPALSEPLRPLIEAGRLRPLSPALDPEFLWFEVVAPE